LEEVELANRRYADKMEMVVMVSNFSSLTQQLVLV